MPKVGMEPIRRKALVNATISEIGRKGSLDVTVSQIAKRAGMSSALAHHYFGGKDQIFLAAMRHILSVYGAQVRAALLGADTPRTRVEAIVRANFEAGNFRPEVIAAWLNFYVLSQSSDGARRLLAVYQHRLHSNLVYGLRPLVQGNDQDVHDLADMIAAQIDGQFIRHALREETPSGKRATAQVLEFIDVMLKARGQ